MPSQDDANVLTRREFIGLAAVAAMFSGCSTSPQQSDGNPHDASPGGMIYRTLGKTGEKVSAIGLGGSHIGRQPEEQESITIIRAAIDNGINFMDNCWDYRHSEERMGKALLNGYRDKVFLMTKVDGRDKRTASEQLDQSLRRLQTDRLDLLQFHEIIFENDPERIFAPGGAIECALEARKAGKVRYIGFSGHKSPAIHLKMLKTAAQHGFNFDTVQMPLNLMDAHFDSFEKNVLPVLVKNNIGVLGMKSISSGNILRSNTVGPIECLHYAMNLPTSVVITGIDSIPILHQAIQAARSFKPMSQHEVSALLARTAAVATRGQFEPYKMTRKLDATFRNPQWLGPSST